MSLFKKSGLFLFLILLLAAFLRFYHLSSIPPSLYSDEIDQGYNAYSLMLTGKDEHGSFFPVSLRSFGDWKPPLQTLFMIPSIYLFGLNEFSVRLPSAVLGLISVYLSYFLINNFSDNYKGRKKIAILTAFIICISPWHILQSRSAMLVMIALFFLELGIIFFVTSRNKISNFYWSIIFFSLSIYSYYGMRIITPFIALLLIYFWKIKLNTRNWLTSFLILSLMMLPLLSGFIKNPNVLFGRAKTVSVFYDQGTNLRLWELVAQDGTHANSEIVRFFHNKPYLYFKKISQNFFSHFNPKYLIIEGDGAEPFHTPGIGIIYFLDSIFLIFGLIYLYKYKFPNRNFFVLFLIVSIIPAALTFMVPSSNRTFNAIFPLSVFIALGFYWYCAKIKINLLHIIIVLIYSASFAYFSNVFFLKIPKNYSQIWNYGWRETVQYTSSLKNKPDNIIVVQGEGMPYVYFLFYNKYSPLLFQQKSVRDYKSDRFGFESVSSFDKYIFTSDYDWQYAKENPMKNSLYIVPESKLKGNEKSVKDINYPNGKIAFKIFRYE